MRVTHVITRLVIGGAQENTVATVLGLRRRPEFQVSLISGPTTGPEGSLVPMVDNILETVPSLVRAVHPWQDFAALQHLTRIFRETKPDIVHTHSGKAGILGRLAAARAGVPIIVHTIHGPSFGDFQGAISNFVFTRAERMAGKVTTHFVSVAEAMTQQYLRAGIGRAEQYTRIFSGFDLSPFLAAKNDPALRRQLGIGDDDVVIGKIARLFKLKGHDDLLTVAPAVIRRCPRVKFLLIGGGTWRGRLKQRAESLGLQKYFIFTGLISPGEIPRYLGLMDLVVHLSRREGLPRALPQALAAGKPVAAYDCDGAREVCLPGETGLLVAPGDLGALADSITRLASDPELRGRLGRQGQEFVRQTFSVATMVEKICTLYCKLAAAQKS